MLWRFKVRQMLWFLSKTEITSARRQDKVMCHVINKQFTQKQMLSNFCWSYVLLLLRIKLLEFTQLIIMDVFHNHGIMMNNLCSQNVFWCTDINHLKVLHRKNIFWHADQFSPSQSQKKYLLLHAFEKTIFSVFRSIMQKWHGFTFVNGNLLQRFWCWHWHGCIWNGG